MLFELFNEYEIPRDGLNLFKDIKSSKSVPILLSSNLIP